jgi:hypothetical protein
MLGIDESRFCFSVSVLFRSIPLCSVPFRSVPFCPVFCFLLFVL